MPAKRRPFKVVRFVPVAKVFKPQIKVRALKDISGWVNRDQGVKFQIGYGRIGYLDEETARVWQAKGYVEILGGTVKPVSADELAELTSKDATLSLGAQNG